MKLKLKHKKIIVIISLLVIGIGALTFSLGQNKDKEVTGDGVGASELVSIEKTDESIEEDESVTEATTEAPTEEPEPEFEVDADPEVVSLVSQYMNAKLEPSVEVFTPLVSDISLMDIDKIERETNTIERYDNITVYSIDTEIEGTSLVYVQHDIKFVGIETLAPAATRFLVVKGEDQVPHIYNGEISEENNVFISEFEETNTYIEFVDEVNSRLIAALEQDSVLAEFYSKMYIEEETEAESESEGETEESTETAETESEAQETEVATE